MTKMSVLVADDDPKSRSLLTANLTRCNYLVHEAQNGEEAIQYLQREIPDLIVLDMIMPVMNGQDVCEWVRQHGIQSPIMVLSAYDAEKMKVRALDAGADDYVTKPFKSDELMARLRALSRRSATLAPDAAENKVTFEGLTIDLKGRRAFIDGIDMRLTRTEIALLTALAENPDRILTHDELLSRVWGEEYRGSNHYLHVYLGRIRKKMGENYGPMLETISGLGYVLHSSLSVE